MLHLTINLFSFVHTTRFRWKNTTQQTKYKNTTLQIPDAKCAEALCRGGAIYYHLKEEADLSDDWICAHVSPNITRVYGKVVGSFLGRALLWRIMDPINSDVLPSKQVKRVRDLYGLRSNELQDDENPVCKVLLEVSGDGNQLLLTPLLPDSEDTDDEDDDEDEGDGVTAPVTGETKTERRRKRRNKRYEREPNLQRLQSKRHDNGVIRMLSARVLHLERVLASREENHQRSINVMMEMLKTTNKNVLKLSQQSYRVVPRHSTTSATQRDGVRTVIPVLDETHIRENAVLSEAPKSLHVLWDEYEKGIGHNLPAKEFTIAEKNNLKTKVKFTYSNRKVFWEFLEKMVNRGHDAKRATEMVIAAYNYQPVSRIIQQLRWDIKGKDGRQLPPSLRMNPNAQ